MTVSEQKAEQTGGELATLSAGPDASGAADVPSKTMLAAALARTRAPAASTDAPALAPKQAGKTSDPGASKADAAKPETIKADAPRAPGKATITSSGGRAKAAKAAVPEVETGQSQATSSKRRRSALAVVVVLAGVAGALGGALATVSLRHFLGGDAPNSGNSSLEASVGRMDADILQLKASVEQNAKLGMSQFNSTNDRLDLVEKAQAELAAKPVKLSEAMDNVRAAPPIVPTTGMAKEATGSIAPPAAAVPKSAPKAVPARLPTLPGWVLRDAANGGALIESRQGVYEVFAGDLVPGLGRIDAVRRQDGRWVVVTGKGLIVPR
ncbi:hypothetical protein [Bradyrhizobium sp.]|jgi:hypothetical protein|uniref:hypothetical protein n=1 Tax=Bradyrhizobium sp. TaxID=376 RepID=UPI003C704E1B